MNMPSKLTPDQSTKKAQAYADAISDVDRDTDYEPTYRDGTLKNECWDSSGWDNRINNAPWRDD